MKRAFSPGCGAVAIDFSSDPRDWVWVGVVLLVLVGVLRFRRRR
ncbi:LPXTG cell wall anchor domain-containing protein [Sorangium sp. So ce1097]